MLRMTVAAVAQAAGVAPNTIVRVEASKSVNTGTLDAIRAVYEAAGVRFQDKEGVHGPPGSGATVADERGDRSSKKGKAEGGEQ